MTPDGGSVAGGGANVFLVGAGPGDPGLLTLRAVELLGSADVVLYDRLIPPEALKHARPDAELVYVGKQGGGPQMPQEEIDRLLVEHGRSGKRVVRLKGGDPLVFGRGGEEALRLREAGIGFEIVPGITAGVAAPAYAGIPVTHRELASGVAFVTGHEDPDKPESALDWAALASSRCVTGMPAYAGAATPAVMPGTISNPMPASRSRSASSPPRPNTSGSPPFSRTTRLPDRPCSTSSRSISSCGICGPPPCLPT